MQIPLERVLDVSPATQSQVLRQPPRNGEDPSRETRATSGSARESPAAAPSPAHDGYCCRSRVQLRKIVGWVGQYDWQRRTRKSMPEPDRMAGTMGSAEHEFEALQGYGLGFIACFDRESGHHFGCRLWWRQNREQVGHNRHSRQGPWHRSFDGERCYGHANE